MIAARVIVVVYCVYMAWYSAKNIRSYREMCDCEPMKQVARVGLLVMAWLSAISFIAGYALVYAAR